MILNVTANVSGKARQETLNGRPHLVVPLRMMVEGVLSGSDGAIFYPKDVITHDVPAWNGMPLTLYHPLDSGRPISARDPAVLNTQGLGVVLKAAGGDALDAEAWFDKALLELADAQLTDNVKIIPRLEKGEPIEVSTGVFVTRERAVENATHNGVPYAYVAKAIKPDHLAVLPDRLGACSVSMGCGLLMANAAAGGTKLVVDNELSHSALHDALNDALRSQFKQNDPSAWVSEVFDTYFVFWQGDKLYQQGYTKSETGVVLSSATPVPVVREVSFVPVKNEESSMKLTANERTAIVAGLIANSCGCWKAGDESILNGLTDDKLKELQASAAAHQKLVGNQKEPEKPTTPAAAATEATINTWMAQQPAEIQVAMKNAMRIEARERTRLVERLTLHLSAEQKPAALQFYGAQPLEALETLAALQPSQPTANASGYGQPSHVFGMPLQRGSFMGALGNLSSTGLFGSGIQQPVTNAGFVGGQQSGTPEPITLETPVMNWNDTAPTV